MNQYAAVPLRHIGNEYLKRVHQPFIEIYDRIGDPDTSLWTMNPIDLAEMVETELRGETIAPLCYFK
jgi:hypothetical protein